MPNYPVVDHGMRAILHMPPSTRDDHQSRHRLTAAVLRHHPDAEVVAYAWDPRAAAALIRHNLAEAVITALDDDALTAAVTAAGGVVHVLRQREHARPHHHGHLTEMVRRLLHAGHLDQTAAAELLGMRPQRPGHQPNR
jgi:hypothetical protein